MTDHHSRAQSLSFLMKRLREVGIEPRKKLGQNFLVDLNLQDMIFRTADIGPNDVVLEVGTGTGSLTVLMADAAAAIVTVELDKQLFELASEELHTMDNVHQLQLDALKNKNNFNPAVIEEVAKHLTVDPLRRLKLVANLPYNVAAPVISNLLSENLLPDDVPPHSMTVTIQKELGDRIVARPGTSDYGALSIWVQAQCRAEIVRVMPPSVFWPRPKVHSAIVHIKNDSLRRSRIPDRTFFHNFVRAMFFHRRKFLRSVLISAVKGKLEKPDVDRILDQVGLDPTLRAEQLDVETMLQLSEAVRGAIGGGAKGD
ncbi:MAG: ribosomal RNA small subunit methyltransferase A [Pirellulales bacterium]|nr:ribosomal RNA small subunit methyltransferase A [Pirellulales bacterium]